ncbi:hypothetical protein MUK51_01805 [Sphingobacterium faecium]|uniref:hypothetical protein n=1 Tax=Sphingobacterium faecium TaxID=34087 RepID=UPI0021B5A838|nr:hypothetical protein [Sphingobacterium faecium]UXD70028.1 hypothetical protein MUK51_01805 [Sphingobacterium faecium]
MDEKYFKLRKAWRPLSNKFDLGGFLKIHPIHASGYFVMRIFSLKEKQYLSFYKYHLQYYLENNKTGNEQIFLAKVIEYIDKDIRSREIIHYYKTIAKTRIYKLYKFREALKQVDKWEITLTNEERIKKSVSYVQEIMDWQNVNDTRTVLSKLLFDEVDSDKFFIEYKNIIEERNQLLNELSEKKIEIQELQKSYKAIAPNSKIQIVSGDHKPLLDLFLQIKDLDNPLTQRGYLQGNPDTWASLLSNYFEYGDKNIPKDNNRAINWNSVRDYFIGKSGKTLLKPSNRNKYFHIKESKRTYQ